LLIRDSVTLGFLNQEKFEVKEPKKFSDMTDNLTGVYYLKDFPSFGGRKGDIQS